MNKRPSARRMSRAEFIRSLGPLEDIEDACIKAHYEVPSRQAVESARRHTGPIGRPPVHERCKTCGQRSGTRAVSYLGGVVPVPIDSVKTVSAALSKGDVCERCAEAGATKCPC